jgi:hypothetical protein
LENDYFLIDNVKRMKKFIVLVCSVFLVISCKDTSVSKPIDLIEKDKMIDILLDVSLLEAIKNQNIGGGLSSKEGYNFLYKKYKIDSIQFVKSNKYYASDIEEYKKMFEKVKERLTKHTNNIEGKMKINGQKDSPTSTIPTNSEVPQIQ